jgi:hypothetical protein
MHFVKILVLVPALCKNIGQMFNIICELPETVARTLVPRMRVVKGTGKAINYLTPPRILLALVSAWVRRGRWFDDEVCNGGCFDAEISTLQLHGIH